MASLEQASKCPKCDEEGNKWNEKPSGRPGNKVLFFRCQNTTCEWGSQGEDDMGWIVEVDPKGNVLERDPRDKQFPSIPEAVADKVRQQAEQVGKQMAKPIKSLEDTPEIGH